MKEWKVSYTDKEGDLSHVRVSACDESDAESVARREYWDIEEVIQVISM